MRGGFALAVAAAAAEAGHPDALALVEQAEALQPAPASPMSRVNLVRSRHLAGDAEGAATTRAAIRKDLVGPAATDPEVMVALVELQYAALEAGATAEARALRTEMSELGLSRWASVHAEVDAASRAGEFEQATAELHALPHDAHPLRGHGHTRIFARYRARGITNPTFESILAARACPP